MNPGCKIINNRNIFFRRQSVITWLMVFISFLASIDIANAEGPNDNPSGATLLYLNGAGTGNVDNSGGDPIDWWKVYISAAGTLSITLDINIVGEDLDLEVYSTDLTKLLCSSTTTAKQEKCSASILSAGDYYVKVYAYASGDASGYTVSNSIQYTPKIEDWYIDPVSVIKGNSFTAYYKINNPNSYNLDGWLGASIRKTGTTTVIDDSSHDIVKSLSASSSTWYSRTFTVPSNASPGSYDVILGLHGGNVIGSGPEWSYTAWENKLTVAQQDTITYRVYNVQNSALPGASGSINVQVYDGTTLVTQDTKAFNGGEPNLQFSFNLNSGKTYRFKTYSTPNIGLNLKEFWGSKDVAVSSSVTVDFARNLLYGGASPYTTPLNPGQSVIPKVTLYNPTSGTLSGQAKLILDLSKTSPFEYEQLSSVSSVSSTSVGLDMPSFTPSAGTYYYYVVIYTQVDGSYVVTDQAVWSKYADVVQPTITYSVHNVPNLPLPGAGGSMNVQVYDGSTLVTQGTKNFNGGESYLDFSFNLNTGKTYRFKTYSTPNIGLGLQEYWGSKDVAVSASNTVDFYRNMLYGDASPYTNPLTAGQSVIPKVILYNPSLAALSGQAKLILDQGKSSPYDYEQLSSVSSVSSTQLQLNMPSFTPSSPGIYYYYVVTYTQVDGSYVVTDQLVWTKYADVVQPTITYRVHNVPNLPLPGAGGSTNVQVYDGSTLVTQGTKNFNGGESYLEFSFNLNAGKTYRFKTYSTPNIGLGLREYWGSKDELISLSGIVDFYRNTLYVSGVETYSQLNKGQSVTPKVTLMDPSTDTYLAKAQLIIDMSRLSPYDYDQTSSSSHITGGSPMDYSLPAFSPSSSGSYYYYAVAYTSVDNTFVITDQTVWPKYAEVPVPGNLVVTILSPSNGFSVTKGTPITVSAKITDNAGTIVTGASLVKATFSNGDSDLVLLDDGLHGDGASSDGIYANTWKPQTTSQGSTETACSITITANHGTLSDGSMQIIGKVISPNPTILDWYISPNSIRPGGSFTAYYYINNPSSINKDAWIGASILKSGAINVIDDSNHDKIVALKSGNDWYSRTFMVPQNAEIGLYDVKLGLHGGNVIGSGSEWDYTAWEDKLTVTTVSVSDASYIKTSRTNLGAIAVEIHIAAEDMQKSGTKDYTELLTSLPVVAAGSLISSPITGFLFGLASAVSTNPIAKTLLLNPDGSFDALVLQVYGDWAWVYKGTLSDAFPLPISFYPIPVKELTSLPVPEKWDITFEEYFPEDISYIKTYYFNSDKKAIEIHIAAKDMEKSGTNDYVSLFATTLTSAVNIDGTVKNFIFGLATTVKNNQIGGTLLKNSDGSLDVLILQVEGNWGWVYKGKPGNVFPLPISFWPIPIDWFSDIPTPMRWDLTFDESSIPPNLPVITPTTITIAPSMFSMSSGNSQTFIATLRDVNNNPIEGKKIRWSDDGKGGSFSLSSDTNAFGQSSIIYNAPFTNTQVSISLTATFDGDTTYQSAKGTTAGIITAKSPSSISPEDIKSSAVYGEAFTVSGMINPAHSASIKINYAKPSKTATTNEVVSNAMGKFSDSIVLDEIGKWYITISWNGDSDHEGTILYPAAVLDVKSADSIQTLTTLIISPSSASLSVSDTFSFTAEPRDQNGNPISATVTWSSGDTNVGTIDPITGEFTAKAAGTATITATSGSVIGQATVTVSPSPSSDSLSNSGGGSWKYQKDLTITNLGSGLSDYQMLVTLDSSNFPIGAKTNGEDIRFTNVSDIELNYWIENWDGIGKNARIWIKVPNIAASGSTSMKMHYGNPSATSSSNGDSTFIFFDDFPGTSINTSKWNLTSTKPCSMPYDPDGLETLEIDANGNLHISEAGSYWCGLRSGNIAFPENWTYSVKLRVDADTNFQAFGVDWTAASFVPYDTSGYPDPIDKTITYSSGDFYTSHEARSANVDATSWGEYIIKRNNTGVYFYDKGSLENIHTNQIPSPGGSRTLHFTVAGGRHMYVEYVKVSKYASPEPSVIAGDVGSATGRIAFVSDKSGTDNVWSIYSDRSGLTQLTSSGNVFESEWSPDGTQIAFSINDNIGNLPERGIWKMNADGSSPSRLTTNHGDYDFQWSPDGTKIIFRSQLTNFNGWFHVWMMNSDGTDQHSIASNGVECAQEWSPDSKKIAYAMADYAGLPADIYVIHADGTQNTKIASGKSFCSPISWSPDGQKIVYSSQENSNLDIYVINPDGTGKTQLTTSLADDSTIVPNSGEGRNQNQIWSLDSQQIVFQSNRNGNWDIYAINRDGTGLTQLTSDQANDYNPTWSPDRYKIAFISERSGIKSIWMMNPDGSNQVQVTDNAAGNVKYLDWSPTVTGSTPPPIGGQILLADNFENYNIGAWPAQGWVPYYNIISDPSNNMVSGDQFTGEGGKSLQLYGSHSGCWAAETGYPITVPDEFYIEADMMASGDITASNSCHNWDIAIGLATVFGGSGVEWRNLLSFQKDGKAYEANWGAVIDYSTMKWYHVKMKVNPKAGTVDYWIDGNYLGQKFSQTLKDKAPDYKYLYLGSGGGKGWIDNVRIWATQSNEPQSTGWQRWGYDLARTHSYPFASNKTISTLNFNTVWTSPHEGKSMGFLTGDVNGDSKLEVVKASGDVLRVLSGDGSEFWNVNVPGVDSQYQRGYLGLSLLDNITGDNASEIFVNRKLDDATGIIYIYKGDGTLYKSFTVPVASDGHAYVVALLDANKDGTKEVLVALESSFAGNPRGTALYDINGNRLWYYAAGFTIDQSIQDINNDGKMEISSISYTVGNGASGCGSGNSNCTNDLEPWVVVINDNGQEIFTKKLPYGHYNTYSRFVDLDRNGVTEVAALYLTGPGANKVFLMDSGNGDILKEYTLDPFSTWWGSTGVADLNKDGKDELIVTTSGDKIRIFDYSLTLLANSSNYDGLSAINDINGDGSLEIIATNSMTNKLAILDSNMNELWANTYPNPPATLISDITGDGINDLIVSADKIYVLSISGSPPTPSDIEPPVIDYITLFPANTTSGSTVNISVLASDNVAVTEVTANGISLKNSNGFWNGSITASSSVGTYTITIRGKDAANNIAESTATYAVVLPQGGIGVDLIPTDAEVPSGTPITVIVKISNTENIDDIFDVELTYDNIPAEYSDYMLNFAWADWHTQKVQIKAGYSVEIPLKITVPEGEAGYKLYSVTARSKNWITEGSNTGGFQII